jgi:hypothetical protein
LALPLFPTAVKVIANIISMGLRSGLWGAERRYSRRDHGSHTGGFATTAFQHIQNAHVAVSGVSDLSYQDVATPLTVQFKILR